MRNKLALKIESKVNQVENCWNWTLDWSKNWKKVQWTRGSSFERILCNFSKDADKRGEWGKLQTFFTNNFFHRFSISCSFWFDCPLSMFFLLLEIGNSRRNELFNIWIGIWIWMFSDEMDEKKKTRFYPFLLWKMYIILLYTFFVLKYFHSLNRNRKYLQQFQLLTISHFFS